MNRVENQILSQHGSSSPRQNLERTSCRCIIAFAMSGELVGSLRAEQTLFRVSAYAVGIG